MKYQYVAYVSVANTPPSLEDIDDLLINSRTFNLEKGITGVLLCHKNTFFQFFEGEPESVAIGYDRIKKSALFQNVLELTKGYSEKRDFDRWSMGFCYEPKSDIQAHAQAEWIAQFPSVNQRAHESFGLKMLKEFWVRLRVKDSNDGDATNFSTIAIQPIQTKRDFF